MFRIFGIVACICLAAATVWCVQLTHAQDAGVAAGQSLERYQRSNTAAEPALPAGPASWNGPSDVARRRIEDILRQAREALQAGRRDEALRLAKQADQVAYQWKVRFGPDEMSPAEMVAMIEEGGPTGLSAADARPADEQAMTPDEIADKRRYVRQLLLSAQELIKKGKYEAARQKALQAKRVDVPYEPFDLRPDHILAEVARHQQASPEGPSEAFLASFEGRDAAAEPAAEERTPMTEPIAQVGSETAADRKARADELLKMARQAMEAGHYDEARSYALEASELDVVYGLFDDRPDHVLADIERKTGTTFIAGAVQKAPGARTEDTAEQKRERALALLREARDLMGRGDLEAARAKALEAQELDASYSLFDDRPELVLQEIRGAQTNQMIADASQAAPAAEPAAGDQEEAHRKAQQLLAEARTALQNGDLETAEQKVSAAEQLDVAYGLFDDRPEIVRHDMARVAASKGRPSTQNLAAAEPAAQPPVPSDTAASHEEQKQRALALLEESRQLLASGKLEEARARAEEARQLNVTYDLFEDRPEIVLAQIDRMAGGASGGSAFSAERPAEPAVAAKTGNTPQADPFAGQPLDLTSDEPQQMASNSPFGGRVANPTRDSAVVPSSQVSALEMYNQGVKHLREGNREAAYEAFLQAYHSGQRLDPYRQQQLQDKIRELAPRGIRQVSGSAPAAAPAFETSPLEAAIQQQQVKYDRLRTEVLNAIFRAERLREKNPEKALQILDQTAEAIAESGLSEQQTALLATSVQNSRSSIEAFMTQHAPLLELERQNGEVRKQIELELANRVRVEQELASLVDEFNRLMDQRRYAEAQVVAKQAKELDAENPAVINMVLKSQIAYREYRNQQLRDAKEETFWQTLDDVEWSLAHDITDEHPISYPDATKWAELSRRREKFNNVDASERSPEEIRVRKSLSEPVSLHFDSVPLVEVMSHIATQHGINVKVDDPGLAEAGVTSNEPVTIHVDGIQLKSALNLILKPIGLDYMIEDEVLQVTSSLRQQGELKTRVYPVADLVVPIPIRAPVSQFQPVMGMGLPGSGFNFPGGQLNVPGGGMQNGLSQVAPGADPLGPAANGAGLPAAGGGNPLLGGGAASDYDFDALTDLIQTTVAPDAWDEFGGHGTLSRHESTLSLVIRQTQKVHQEIADLLEQLRRLQDLQVTIEVRFITVSDSFFERIGIDFDFNVNDTVGGPNVDNDFFPLNRFGSVDPNNGSTGGVGQGGQNNQGGNQNQAGSSPPSAPFAPGPDINIVGRDDWPGNTVVGLIQPNQFSSDLDIPFRQGSFDIGVPEFGGFQPEAGLQFGMAILSDIEAFLFVQAAQGDERSNILFAPKLTLFNGQTGSVVSQLQRPFVVSVTPVATAFSIGFQPVVVPIPEGVQLTVRAVVSADRRYVRLAVSPFFTNVTDVFTFSFVSGGGGAGGIGGIGGGGIGGGGFGGGFGGGIGGGIGGVGGGIGGIGGQTGGGQQNQQGTAGGSVTVQQPVIDVVTVDTVVSVPDGGTVLLGGVKRLREGRSMSGVPILNKIPYVSRLFKNTGVGRETDSLMLMVTPRIIIQEEEEELLGIPQ